LNLAKIVSLRIRIARRSNHSYELTTSLACIEIVSSTILLTAADRHNALWSWTL